MTEPKKIESVETVFLDVGYRKALWDYAKGQTAAIKSAVSQRESEIRQLQKDAAFWEKITAGCEHGICPECKGQKGWHRPICQDEAEWVRCKKCNGTGEVREPPDIIGKIGLLAPRDP